MGLRLIHGEVTFIIPKKDDLSISQDNFGKILRYFYFVLCLFVLLRSNAQKNLPISIFCPVDWKIIKIIEDVGAKVMFLPPYSPDFNPIEKMWSKMKSVLRSMQAKNYEDLLKGVSHALRTVSPQDAQGWFRSCNV